MGNYNIVKINPLIIINTVPLIFKPTLRSLILLMASIKIIEVKKKYKEFKQHKGLKNWPSTIIKAYLE